MISNVIFQKNGENTLAENLKQAFLEKPKKAYFFCGTVKETGFRIIEDELIDNDVKSYFVIGIDKKNTTRVMLEDILRYTSDLYVYSNNNDVEFSSNMWIFEYTKKIVIFSLTGSVSENLLTTDHLIYTKTTVDLDDKEESKEIKKQIKDILKVFEELGFEKVNKTKIENLAEQKEIFTTRQYVHNVMSISELLGKKEDKVVEEKVEVEDEYEPKVEMPKFDLSDIDIDIDIPMEEVIIEDDVEKEAKKEEVKKSEKVENIDISIDEDIMEVSDDVASKIEEDIIDKDNELYDESLEDFDFDENSTLDINSMLFEKSNIKLDRSNEDEEKENTEVEEEKVVQTKMVNLTNVTNYIFELPSKPTKGQDVCNIKIPSYINQMIPEFFELNEKGKNEKIDDADYKIRKIELEIVDVKSGEKFKDKRAKIMHKIGQTYLSFSSDFVRDINYSENDIVRIIKLSSDLYHIEVISKELQEYGVWSKLCNQNFKSSDRKYGMM